MTTRVLLEAMFKFSRDAANRRYIIYNAHNEAPFNET